MTLAISRGMYDTSYLNMQHLCAGHFPLFRSAFGGFCWIFGRQFSFMATRQLSRT